MTFPFISNPLGSGGYAPQALGNLTAGLNALQQTEIGRRLNEIQQNKAWEHDQKLRDEKLMLDAMSKQAIDDLRVGIAKDAMDKSEAFRDEMAKMWQQAQREGRSLSGEERLRVSMGLADIDAQITNSTAMADAWQKAQPIMAQMAGKLTGERLDVFQKRISDFMQVAKDPEASKKLKPSDIAMLYQPIELTPAQEVAGFMSNIKGTLTPSYTTGSKVYDKSQTVSAIANQLQSDDYALANARIYTGLPADAPISDIATSLEQSYRGTLSQGMTAGKYPSGEGTDKQREKYNAVVSENIEKATEEGMSSGIKITSYANPINLVYKGKEGAKTISKFTPTQIIFKNDGSPYVEGNITATAGDEIPMSAEDALRADVFGASMTKLEPTGEKDSNGNPVFLYRIKNTASIPISRPYNDLKEEMNQKIPNLNDLISKAKGSGQTTGEQPSNSDPLGLGL